MKSNSSHYSGRTVRKNRRFSRSVIVAGFTTAYTLVVLPFTVNFFRAIASVPATGATLFAVIPLDKAHLFVLPLFLAALEFASIQLARQFWAHTDRTERALVFGLFLTCQSFTVASVYYDVQNGHLKEERKTIAEGDRAQVNTKEKQLQELQTLLATKRSQSFREKENQITRVTQRISAIGIELDALRQGDTTLDQGIASLLVADGSSAASTAAEITERRGLRRKREMERTSLLQERAGLERDLTTLETGLNEEVSRLSRELDQLEAEEKRLIANIAQPGKFTTRSPSSVVEYIVANLATSQSAFAALIAFLFPVTILGMGFVLRSLGGEADRLQSLNLQPQLTAAAAYCPEGQRVMSRHLLCAISMYITGLRASNELSVAQLRVSTSKTRCGDQSWTSSSP